MPFKDFKEHGIAVQPGPGDEEVDALGIPTIPLKVRHATDVCKTNTKRKHQAEQAKARKRGGGAKSVPWYEDWEQSEAARFATGVNPSVFFSFVKAATVLVLHVWLLINLLTDTLHALSASKLQPQTLRMAESGQSIMLLRLVLNSSSKRFVYLHAPIGLV